MSKILKSYGILHLGLPVSNTRKSFTDKNVQIKSPAFVKELQNPYKISSIYSFLSKISTDPDWTDYLNLKSIEFDWFFIGHWKSSNPFFELHMRCMLRLLQIFQKVMSGYSRLETEHLKSLVNAINFSFHETLKDDHVIFPILLWPPNIYENFQNPYNGRGSYFIPVFGSHSFQVLIYLIVVETWMNILEDKIFSLTKEISTNCEKDIISLYDNIVKVTTKCFDRNNPWSHYQEFNDYCFFRYSLDNEYSDLNRLYSLGRLYFLDDTNNQLYVKKIITGFTSPIISCLQKLPIEFDENQRDICTKPIEFFMFGKSKETVDISMLSLSTKRKPIYEIMKFSTKMPKEWIQNRLAIEGKLEEDNDDQEDVIFEKTSCCNLLALCTKKYTIKKMNMYRLD